MTQRTYFMLCWSFQLSLVCMLRNVRDDSMRGLGSEHLLRVHDSHFQLGCCSPTRACLLLCSPQALLEHISLFFTNTFRPCCLCFKNMHFTVVLSCSKQAHPWWLVALHRVASGMNNGCRQLAVSQCCNLQTIFISHVQLSRQLPIIVITSFIPDIIIRPQWLRFVHQHHRTLMLNMKKHRPSSPDGFYCLVDIWIDGLIYLQ